MAVGRRPAPRERTARLARPAAPTTCTVTPGPPRAPNAQQGRTRTGERPRRERIALRALLDTTATARAAQRAARAGPPTPPPAVAQSLRARLAEMTLSILDRPQSPAASAPLGPSRRGAMRPRTNGASAAQPGPHAPGRAPRPRALKARFPQTGARRARTAATTTSTATRLGSPVAARVMRKITLRGARRTPGNRVRRVLPATRVA